MNIHEALLTRRTVHLWKAESLPEGVIERALQAAHMAPCHRYTWPWKFYRCGTNTRSKLFDLAVSLKRKGDADLSERLQKKMIQKVKNPAELIVVTLVHCEDDFTARENYAAASCAIQNMALSIHGDGYASKWSTGGLTSHDQTYELLNIDKADEEIIGFVWVGVPEAIPKTPKRTPLEDHIHFID